MKAKDRLYAEAEAVYRRILDESTRIIRAGGVTEPTEVILATTEGKARDDFMATFESFAEDGLRAIGDDPTLAMRREPGISREGSIVALRVCVDSSGWSFYRGDKLESRGRVGEDRVYFSRFGENLKAVYVEGRWVEKCDV
jgi:predicted acyl esterase